MFLTFSLSSTWTFLLRLFIIWITLYVTLWLLVGVQPGSGDKIIDTNTLHIPFICPFCSSTLSTILCIKDQYIMIQYSAFQNCIVQYSVVQYNTELPCYVHRCTTVQLSALHDKVQDKCFFNYAGVSSKQKMGIIWKVHFWNFGKFGRVETPPD